MIEGPRAAGKTWTAREVAGSEVLLDINDEARKLARLEPAELLAGRTPRLIDEWQLEPHLWNHVRHTVDDARNVATYATVATMAADVGGSEGPLGDHTARSYLTALERLMLVENQPPWASHLRSRSRLRVSPKRHLVDPSLATAAVRADPEYLLRDVTWFGFLFESMVVRDLRIYAQAMDRVDASRCGEPATLGVIVHGGYAYMRPDGVAVIPVGALGP